MSNKKIIITVDSGASNTKAKSEVGTLLYATKVTEGFTTGFLGENTFNAEVDGVRMTIGDKAEYADKREGKDTNTHIWSTLVAVAKLRGDAEKVVLGYGESYNKYVQDEQREAIKSKLEGEHTVIFYEGNNVVEHRFTIELVQILPEGLGSVLIDLENNLGLKYVLDWGGSTVNFLEINDGQPTENSQSFQLGSYNVYAKVKKALAQSSVGAQSDLQVKTWVDKGCDNIQIQEIIDDVIKKQLQKIDNELDGYGINLHKYLEVEFIGGTAKLFNKQIKSYFKCAKMVDRPLTCNVDGFYEYMRLVYND